MSRQARALSKLTNFILKQGKGKVNGKHQNK